jgi:hypothetical protein
MTAAVTALHGEQRNHEQHERTATDRSSIRPTAVQDYRQDGEPDRPRLGIRQAAPIKTILEGQVKIPMGQLTLIAAAFGIDSAFLLRLMMKEFLPDTRQAFADVFPHYNPDQKRAGSQ